MCSVAPTRTFNGKIYDWWYFSRSKIKAQNVAIRLRREGSKARVLRDDNGWSVYQYTR